MSSANSTCSAPYFSTAAFTPAATSAKSLVPRSSEAHVALQNTTATIKHQTTRAQRMLQLERVVMRCRVEELGLPRGGYHFRIVAAGQICHPPIPSHA